MRRLPAAKPASDVGHGVLRAVCLLAAGAAIVSQFTAGNGPVAGVLGLALGLTLLVALWRGIGTEASRARWSGAGLGLLAVIAAASFGWAAAFSSVQASDFGVYWRCGVDEAISLSNLMEACRSKYISMERLYGERTLLYTRPFGVLFGAAYPLFKLYNAALHVLTAAVVWVGCRRFAGPRAAFIAVAVLAASAEWWFTLTLATPDNLALLAIAAMIWAAAELGATGRPVSWICLLGAALLVAQWSRSVGVAGVAACLAFCLLDPSARDRRRQLLLTGGAVLLYLASNAALNGILGGPKSEATLLATASAVDLGSGQGFAVGFAWLEHLWRAIPEEARTRVALHRIGDELLYGFAGWPAYMAEKARVLFQGDGYLFFATWRGADNLDSAFPVALSTVPSAPWILTAARAAPVATLTLVAGALLRGGFERLGDMALAFASAFLALVLGLAEVQPRYGVILAPALALLVASAFREGDAPRARTSLPPLLLGLVLLAMIWTAGVLVTRALRADPPPGLEAARQGAAEVIDGTPCNTAPVALTASRRVLRVTLPPGASCATIVVPISGPRAARASFFVARERLPFAFERLPPAGFRYGFRAGPDTLHWDELGHAAVRWHETDLEGGGAAARSVELAVARVGAPGELTIEVRDLQQWD